MAPKTKPIKDETRAMQEMAEKIGDTDEMKLQLLEAADPNDILYPPELNAHLIDQLKIMTGENNQLRKLIFSKDQELEEATKAVEEMQQKLRDIISGSGPTVSAKSAGIISQKITDLCKQNRHLIADIESFKTKNAALERKILQLEILTKNKEEFDVCMCKDERVEGVSPDEFRELSTKLASVNKKLCDTKNRNLELKNEILAATKILQQELGDKFTSIKELQNDIAGWKGRAQQIVCLQAKIADLEEKLNAKFLHEKSDVFKKSDQSVIIKEIEQKRKKELDQTLKEHSEFKDENIALKKKLDAARCRVRNLECDATLIRQKMHTLVEKSNHDDMLVNEQRNQIKTLELYYQEILKENTVKMNKMQNQINEYEKNHQNFDAKIDALRKQTNEKTSKIEELRAQLLRYEECSLQSVFFTPLKTATDNEIKKLSQLVTKLNERLDNERHRYEDLELHHRRLKEKKRKLEKKVTALETEVTRLSEIKKVSRTSRTSAASKDLLEPSTTFGLGSIQKLGKKRSSIETNEGQTTSESSPSASENENMDKDELKYKLELTEEKLKIMEDKLKMLEEEKLEDNNHLIDMIQNSKQLFNEALAVLQKEKCLCSTKNTQA